MYSLKKRCPFFDRSIKQVYFPFLKQKNVCRDKCFSDVSLKTMDWYSLNRWLIILVTNKFF